jgi:4-hydroxybenzoate polyprenyltransferase
MDAVILRPLSSMKILAAFFQLIRWPNLFFIALTQWLFYKCVVFSQYTNTPEAFSEFDRRWFLFYCLMAASILIAAAGYIINDYFDRQIDAVNKPAKVVVDKTVKRRWAIIWHLVFSVLGVAISFYVSYRTGTWVIFLINTAAVLLLWLYSTRFKKKLLTGNVLIAALTAWVVIVVYFFAGASILDKRGWQPDHFHFNIRQLFKFTMLYAGFSFIVSLIREVVKDIEDIDGDRQYHCNTMPIAWGIPAAKIFAAVWIIVCIAALAIVQLYAWQSGWWQSAVYCSLLIILPLIVALRWLVKAKVTADYRRISHLIKGIMLAGILSMLSFKIFA